MPNDKDFSIEDEAYLHAVAAEPKMTTDELVGDDGNPTLDPSTAKGSLTNALDEALSADTDLEHTTITRDRNDGLDAHLTDPTDDFRDETKGELEGSTDTPQNLLQPIESNKVDEGLKPMIQQDSATPAKESLAYALDSITMDGAEEIEKKPPVGKDPQPDYSDYSEENASHIDFKAPNIPQSMGGDEDKPDANGLVYVSATFTVDPEKYISNNYRPSNTAQAPDAQDVLKKASAGMMGQGQEQQAVTPEEEEALSDLGTPEAKESAMQPTEPTEQQEEQAAKDADKEQKKELDAEAEEERKAVIPKASDKADKPAQDEAIDKVVLDYATFIDGSSFMCFDEISDIDYTKIAMDAGPKKPVTRQNCQTTFAQCRAKNPLFCRFHGPKLLEADIKTAIKATVGNGCVVSVTKDSAAKNKFTFRLTVGCPPSKKMMVEKMIHMYLTQNPGITSSTEDWNLAGKHKQTLEFDMDLLRADKPPEKNDVKGKKAVIQTKKDKAAKKVQGVVGETAPALEKKAAKGEKWETVDESVESEWADVVDKNVNKSLLANNQEFIDAFNKIANDFDAAHDKGDAEGLKKALDALKAEIGKYDENGEKKLESATETAPSLEAPQEQAQAAKVASMKGLMADDSSVSKTTPESEGTTVDRKVTKEDILDFFGHKTGKMDKADLQKWLELANNGTYNGGSPTEYFDAPSPVYKNVGEGLQKVMEMKGADHPMTKALVKAGLPLPEGMDDSQPTMTYESTDKGDSIKLPAVAPKQKKGSSGNGGDGDSSQPSPQVPKDPKVADLMSKVDELSGKAKELGIEGDAKVASLSNECKYYIQEIGYSEQEIKAFTDKLQEADGKDDYGTANELVKTMFTTALNNAQGGMQAKIMSLESATKNFADYIDTYQKESMDKAKLSAADSVESSIKNLSAYIFGGKRPPKGVDSVGDYIDYQYDAMQTAAKDGGLSTDEVQKMEDTYHVGDAMAATKAASKQMDDLIEEFKDKMDSPPTQSEDYGSYQADIEQMNKSIKAASVELMAAHDAFKTAIEKCNYEAAEAKKLAESKKKLGEAQVKPGTQEKSPSQQRATTSENTVKSDLSSKVGNPFEGLQHDIKPLISNALSKNGGFTNFNTFDDTSFEGTKHFISMEKKQKEGYDEDYDEEESPTQEELDKLLKQMNEEFSMYGLQVKPSTKMKNFGKNVYFEVEKLDGGMAQQEQAQPKKQLSDEEKKAKIAAMSPKQKLEAAVKIFKKKLAADPSNAEAKAKLAKYEAMLSKLDK